MNFQFRKNVLFNALAQFSSIAFVFLYMAIMLDVLGVKEYGVWLTITAVTQWLVQFDLGYGNGLRNTLTKLWFEKNHDSANSVIASSFFYFSLFTGAIFILGSFVFYLIVELNLIEKESSIESFNLSVFIMCAASLLHMVMNIVNGIAYSIHKSYYASFRASLLNFIVFLGTLYAWFDFGQIGGYELLYFSKIYLLAVIVSNIVVCKCILSSSSFLNIDLTVHRFEEFKAVFCLGSRFFLLQLTALMLFTSDILLVSWLLGPEKVPEFAMSNRVFLFIIMMQGFFMAPMWSMYTHYYADSKIELIKSLLNTSLLISVGFAALLLPLWWFLSDILMLWTHKDFLFSEDLAIALVVLYIIRILSSNYSTLLNGLSVLAAQIHIGYLSVAINLLATIIFVKIFDWGVSGVAYGTALAMLPFLIISPRIVSNELRMSEGNSI